MLGILEFPSAIKPEDAHISPFLTEARVSPPVGVSYFSFFFMSFSLPSFMDPLILQSFLFQGNHSKTFGIIL
jgi:hypothetical protein